MMKPPLPVCTAWSLTRSCRNAHCPNLHADPHTKAGAVPGSAPSSTPPSPRVGPVTVPPTPVFPAQQAPSPRVAAATPPRGSFAAAAGGSAAAAVGGGVAGGYAFPPPLLSPGSGSGASCLSVASASSNASGSPVQHDRRPPVPAAAGGAAGGALSYAAAYPTAYSTASTPHGSVSAAAAAAMPSAAVPHTPALASLALPPAANGVPLPVPTRSISSPTLPPAHHHAAALAAAGRSPALGPAAAHASPPTPSAAAATPSVQPPQLYASPTHALQQPLAPAASPRPNGSLLTVSTNVNPYYAAALSPRAGPVGVAPAQMSGAAMAAAAAAAGSASPPPQSCPYWRAGACNDRACRFVHDVRERSPPGPAGLPSHVPVGGLSVVIPGGATIPGGPTPATPVMSAPGGPAFAPATPAYAPPTPATAHLSQLNNTHAVTFGAAAAALPVAPAPITPAATAAASPYAAAFGYPAAASSAAAASAAAAAGVDASRSQQLCLQFTTTGVCAFGAACPNLHFTPEGLAAAQAAAKAAAAASVHAALAPVPGGAPALSPPAASGIALNSAVTPRGAAAAAASLSPGSPSKSGLALLGMPSRPALVHQFSVDMVGGASAAAAAAAASAAAPGYTPGLIRAPSNIPMGGGGMDDDSFSFARTQLSTDTTRSAANGGVSLLSLAAAAGSGARAGFATSGLTSAAPLANARHYDAHARCARCGSSGTIYPSHKHAGKLCWRCCPCTLCDSPKGAVCEMGFCAACYTPAAGPRLR